MWCKRNTNGSKFDSKGKTMTTTRHVALLRGINVGKAKRIAMADLRALVEGLGHGNVRTLLNSGNVVFDAGDGPETAATRIENAIATDLGVSSKVIVLTLDDVARVVAENPLTTIADDPSRLLVAVFNDKTDRKTLEPLLSQEWTPDAAALGTRVAYLWCSGGILESRLAAALGKTLKDSATTRNWATFLNLLALMRLEI